MLNFKFSIGRNRLPNYVERGSDGSFFYSIINAFKSLFTRGLSDSEKFEAIRTNLGVLFVFDFIAKNYSQQKIHEYRNNKLKNKDVLYSIQKQPNQWQTWTDFLYDYAFWLSAGRVAIYKQGDNIYCLNPFKITLTNEQQKNFAKLSFSKYGESTIKNIKKGTFKYCDDYDNNYNLELSNLHIVNDLSAGVNGNWFNGGSKLDALHQVVKNLDLTLKAKYINTEFTGKFIASGQQNPQDAFTPPLSTAEQSSIEQGLRSNKQVIAVKSKVDINRFVSDLNSLKLDDSIIADIHLIGMMYGLNKDVISIALKGSTYENKEKSFGAFVDYTLTPISKQMTDLLEQLYDIEELRGEWSHLPFNQVFEAEMVANNSIKLDNLIKAKDLGLSDSEIKKQLNIIYGN